MIPITKLINNTWYYGDSNIGPVALWFNHSFLIIHPRTHLIKSLPYPDFKPLAIIDSSFSPSVIHRINKALFPK